MKQRALSFLLAVCLTLAPGAWAAESFSDVPPDHWAHGDIMTCTEAGTVNGVGNGKFDPEGQVTGIQFIVMLTRTFYNDAVEAAKATETGSWYAPNMQIAEDVNILKNLTVEDKSMNRYDMACALYNVLKYEQKVQSVPSQPLQDAQASIKDWASIPTSRMAQVKYCYALGILSGMSDGCFHGEQTMTRAQACAVIVRMINLIINGEAPAHPQQPEQPQQPEAPAQTGTGKLANGKDATVENVLEILDQIRREYPDDTPWGTIGKAPYFKDSNSYPDGYTKGHDIYNWGGEYFRASLTSACGGFMAMVSDRIFGSTGAPVREVLNVWEAWPGDLIVKYNKNGITAHGCILLSVGEPYANTALGGVMYNITTTDGNVNPDRNHLNGVIKWDNSRGIWNNFGAENFCVDAYYRCFTRYPE